MRDDKKGNALWKGHRDMGVSAKRRGGGKRGRCVSAVLEKDKLSGEGSKIWSQGERRGGSAGELGKTLRQKGTKKAGKKTRTGKSNDSGGPVAVRPKGGNKEKKRKKRKEREGRE